MNSQSFDLTKQGNLELCMKFINNLIDYNSNEENTDYNDIHIKQEECFVIVEWENIPYNHEWGGQFRYIDWDDAVMKEVTFPDGHYDYLFPEEVDETLKRWHEEHPEWVMTEYGTWTNAEENRRCNIDWSSKDFIKRAKEGPIPNVYVELDLSNNCSSAYSERIEEIIPDNTDYIALSVYDWGASDLYKIITAMMENVNVDLSEESHIPIFLGYLNKIPVYSTWDMPKDSLACLDKNHILIKVIQGVNEECN